jgi:two-component system OmpR family response regulator
MRLLLAEDDKTLSEQLCALLRRSGFIVDSSSDGIDAEYRGDIEDYDAIILDLGLPGRPGLKVLSNWRARNNDVPVLVLTARGAWHEKVEGFRTGADDYLAKPFHNEELVARLHALIRRRHGRAHPILQAGDMRLDTDRQCAVLRDGSTVTLTATEFRLLQYLMMHAGNVISKSRLLEQTWSANADTDENLVEVYINRLRGKLGSELIETRRGQGYVLRDKQ